MASQPASAGPGVKFAVTGRRAPPTPREREGESQFLLTLSPIPRALDTLACPSPSPVTVPIHCVLAGGIRPNGTSLVMSARAELFAYNNAIRATRSVLIQVTRSNLKRRISHGEVVAVTVIVADKAR
uniref:(northern house mosquito) hypothetical protein n=1 Tax=Culex pipiens TaxID=7175 RepID=A0A8D8FK93_CULPI